MDDSYDPEWVEWEKTMGRPELPEEVNARRAAFNDGIIAMSKALPSTDPGITTRDEQISPEVNVRIYRPPDSDDKKLPLVVFFPGGGWQAGNLDTEDHMCRTVCERVGCAVVSVDYRKYPEVTFPGPIDDCYAAYQWAYEHATEFGADKNRCFVWGGSAGGSLAISVVYKLVSTGQSDRIRGLIVMAGMFLHPDAVPEKYKDLHVSYVENGGDTPVVAAPIMLLAYDLLVEKERLKDVEWFPASAAPESLKGFPRTYIINTEKEALRDDGRVLEAGLRDAGVEVKRDCMPALPHYFWVFPVAKAGARLRDLVVEGIQWVVSSAE